MSILQRIQRAFGTRNGSWILLTRDGLHANLPHPWFRPWEPVDGLPKVDDIVAAIGEQGLEPGPAAVLLKEDWLRPVRIEPDANLAKGDVSSYIAWRYKRYLPYASDQAEVRYTALGDGLGFLATALPKPWIHDLTRAFEDRGVQLGYIGSTSALFEGQQRYADQMLLCLMDGTYFCLALNRKGQIRDYLHRRTPLTESGEMDTQTIVDRDISRVHAPTARVMSLHRACDGAVHALVDRMAQAKHLATPLPLTGPVIQRVIDCCAGEAVFV